MQLRRLVAPPGTQQLPVPEQYFRRKTMNFRKWISCALLTSLVLLGVTGLFAQNTATASLQGTVTDNQNALVPGAEITLTSRANGQSRTVKTNNIGEYRFDDIQPGLYTVST